MFRAILVVLCFFACTSQPYAQPSRDPAVNTEQINVPWDCPGSIAIQTAQGDEPPTYVPISVPLRFATGLNQLPTFRYSLDTLGRLASTLQNAHTDLSYCSFIFLERLKREALTSCVDHFQYLNSRLKQRVARQCALSTHSLSTNANLLFRSIFEQSASHHPLPTHILLAESIGDRAYARFSSEEKASVIKRIRATCNPIPEGGTEVTSNVLGYIYSREFLERELPGIFSSSDERCQAKLVTGYLRLWRRDLIGEADTASNCVADLTLEPCTRYRNSLRALLQILPEGHLDREILEDLRCTRESELRSILADSTFEHLRQTANDAADCAPLDIGSDRVISLTDDQSATGLSQNYLLKRLSLNQYRATVNLHFQGVNSLEERRLRTRVRQCFLDVAPLMRRDPMGLELALAPPSIETFPHEKPGNRMPNILPSIDIQIRRHHIRSSSQEWELGIDCPTIIHEVGHTLGWADEYIEVESGYCRRPHASNGEIPYVWVPTHAETPGYNCRTIGPENSVMSNQWDAIAAARIGGNNLILPAQMRSVIYPSCELYNSTYYACAGRAYISAEPGRQCPHSLSRFCSSTSNQLNVCRDDCRRLESQRTECLQRCEEMMRAWLL